MILTIDGQLVKIPIEIQVMILALLDNQDQIQKQQAGAITLDYRGCDVVLTLSRRVCRTKARSPLS